MTARNTRWVLLSVAGLLGLAIPSFIEMVGIWGRQIPQEDLPRDYLVAAVWAFFLTLGIFLWPVPPRDRAALLVLWGAKVFVALGFMLLYESRYGLDAYMYFEESRLGPPSWERIGLGSGTENIIALSWLHNQVLSPSYHAMKVSFSMIGLVGIYVFYRSAVLFMGREDRRLLYFLGLFPSILFWSSILGKDPVVFLGIGLYVYGVVGWSRRRNHAWYLFVGAAGMLIAMFIRMWLGPILLVPLIVLALDRIRSVPARVAFVAVALAVLAGTVSQFTDQLGLETAEDLYSTTESVSQAWAEGGAGQERKGEFTSLRSMLLFAPLGAFTALFRPLPGEILNPFGMLAGLENLLLLTLLGLSVQRTRWRTLREPLVTWALALIVTWAALYGFISYQNLGTAVRFRLQILPVLLGVLIYLARSTPRASRASRADGAPLPSV